MSKRVFTLLAVLVILIAALIVVQQVNKTSTIKKYPKIALSEDKIVSVTIRQTDKSEPIRFEKVPDGWDIHHKAGETDLTFKADSNKIDPLLKTICELKIFTNISKKSDEHAVYSVDNASGIEVLVKDEESKETKFIIGKVFENRRSTAFRFADNDVTYKVSGAHRDAFNKKLEDWREKKLFSIKQEDISGFAIAGAEIKKGQVEFLSEEIKKDEPVADTAETTTTPPPEPKTEIKWKNVKSNQFVKKNDIDSFIKTVVDLRCDKFIDNPSDKYKVDKPLLTITLTSFSESKVLYIDRMEKEGDNKDKYLVHVEGRTSPYYYIPNHTFKQMLKINDVKPEEKK